MLDAIAQSKSKKPESSTSTDQCAGSKPKSRRRGRERASTLRQPGAGARRSPVASTCSPIAIAAQRIAELHDLHSKMDDAVMELSCQRNKIPGTDAAAVRKRGELPSSLSFEMVKGDASVSLEITQRM